MKRVVQILIVLSGLLSVYTIYDYIKFGDKRLLDAIEKGEHNASRVKNHLDSMAVQVKLSADSLATRIELEDDNLKRIEQLVKSELQSLPFIHGITVAFEPYAHSNDQRLSGLYYISKQDRVIMLEQQYDYTDESLETAKWYTKCRESQQPIMTNPYFGVASNQLVLDYSVPLFRIDPSGQKEFYGVLSFTVAPDDFTEYINRFVQGNSGYLYLMNLDGFIITHPNRNFILNHKGLDFEYSDDEKHLAESMISNKNGYFEYVSPYTGVTSMLFYNTVDLIGWKLAIVYSRADLLGNPRELEQKIIHVGFAVSLLLLFVVISVFGFHEGTNRDLWNISIAITFIFISNIILIWLIQLKMDYSEELDNRTRVYSNSALESFVDSRNYIRKMLGQNEYQLIPTGLFIDELVVTDSYDMSVSGKIWQKWPKDHDLKDKLGFEFTQASPIGRSVMSELLSRDELDEDTWLYTWKFNATLRIFFDYNQFPLDQHYVDIKLRYPDLTDNIMLVPDFESYEVLNPAAKPGLSDIIFLPRHRIIASYFSFSSMDLKTFFGQKHDTTSAEYEILEYNIVVKRRFITPFISFVIPFILGASIIFFLLYSLNKDKEDKSGVTVMGVVQGMAALFFSMLLAHITIRNRIPTPSVTYMESFYFIIYVLITLLILIVVMYSRSDRYRFLNYRDNLMVKISYWPILIGMLYLITLIKFY